MVKDRSGCWTVISKNDGRYEDGEILIDILDAPNWRFNDLLNEKLSMST